MSQGLNACGLCHGCQGRGFKTDPEPYHADVGDISRVFYLNLNIKALLYNMPTKFFILIPKRITISKSKI